MLLKSFPIYYKGDKLRNEIANLTFGANLEKLVSEGSVNFIIQRILDNTFSENFKRNLKTSYGDLANVRNQLQKDNLAVIDIYMKSLNFKFVLWDRNESNGGIVELNYNDISMVSEQNHFYTLNDFNEACYTILAEFFREIRPFAISLNYIPAVRSGYYLGLSNLGSIIAKINQYQGAIGAQSFTLPNTTVPVSDFYSTISNKSAFTSAEEYKYKSVVDKIEQNILKGTVQIDKESGRIHYFSNELQRTFDLSQVSSMVSELSIITAYFKYIIWDHVTIDNFEDAPSLSVGVYPTLFIEEPEAHLHPEAQVLLMQYFVDLANLGLKIIMTTHSDYMFSKLGNEILAGHLQAADTGSYLLEMEDKGSCCNNIKMLPEDTGIDDFNFYPVTEQLYRERIKLNDEYYERIDKQDKKS
jgi:hypothetical protein